MVILYSTENCAYCKMVETFLIKKNVKYRTIKLDNNPSKRQELFEKTGALTVPIIEKDNQFVVGWNPAKLTKMLNA